MYIASNKIFTFNQGIACNNISSEYTKRQVCSSQGNVLKLPEMAGIHLSPSAY